VVPVVEIVEVVKVVVLLGVVVDVVSVGDVVCSEIVLDSGLGGPIVIIKWLVVV